MDKEAMPWKKVVDLFAKVLLEVSAVDQTSITYKWEGLMRTIEVVVTPLEYSKDGFPGKILLGQLVKMPASIYLFFDSEDGDSYEGEVGQNLRPGFNVIDGGANVEN